MKSDADVLGSAFEVMINPGMKGDKGQYFTPRHVVKMCIEILSPKDDETFFDPACGSGGFLIYAMDYVYRLIEKERDDKDEVIENKKDYANECIYGIDYDPMIAKVAKAYMLIWGDGRANIAICDSLNQDNWNNEILSKFTINNKGKIQLKQFDNIATNPPFAGDISSDDTLSKYELAFKPTKSGGRKRMAKLSREKLFLERCINMLSPLGKLAIVVPRGILKNYNDEYIRRFILREARIVGVVGLGKDMFKPFTNTKTCVLFLQKRDKTLKNINEVKKDPSIVFCVSEKSGKDKSGNLILNEGRKVISDFGEITEYFNKNASWFNK